MNKINELSKNNNLSALPPQLYSPIPNFIGRWTNTKDNTIYFDINSDGLFNKVGGLFSGSYNPQYNYNGYSIFYKPSVLPSPSEENKVSLIYRNWNKSDYGRSYETYIKI